MCYVLVIAFPKLFCLACKWVIMRLCLKGWGTALVSAFFFHIFFHLVMFPTAHMHDSRNV